MFKSVLSIILIILIIAACDHGLAPPEEVSGISGTITYQNWPPDTSVRDLRLVIFRNYPPEDIIAEVSSGTAEVYPELTSSDLLTPYGADSSNYLMKLDPRLYEYVVVAQQYGEDIMSDWRAVGQYDTTGTGLDSIPTPITVLSDSILTDINIDVDFNNLPFQPF